jgi:hypothetical protein
MEAVVAACGWFNSECLEVLRELGWMRLEERRNCIEDEPGFAL